ncbi:hypothetical protein M404DRAFT_1001518 [Pisolithus tinctorius Marx 270]|uniref:Uncharacterized protein n=1 Tax=Pisolithus tinctorius Marx 270 TaxID=870435 RepID=A0A0C3P6P0_PISTI|nr:hypothetical protein M404DRAFT_1001518 [Pisolithus tinctorius Marx 270]
MASTMTTSEFATLAVTCGYEHVAPGTGQVRAQRSDDAVPYTMQGKYSTTYKGCRIRDQYNSFPCCDTSPE